MELTLSRDLAAVYVLNLARRQDRFEKFLKRAEAAGLKGRLSPQRIPGADGKAMLATRLNPHANLTESATTMGHRFLWGLALAHNKPVLILEDDACFCRNFSAHLERPLHLPDNMDLLQLGMSWLQTWEHEGPIRTPKHGFGLFSYVLFPEGAWKLLRRETAAPLGIADHYSKPQPDWDMKLVYPTWVRGEGDDSDIAVRANPEQRFGNHFEDGPPVEHLTPDP